MLEIWLSGHPKTLVVRFQSHRIKFYVILFLQDLRGALFDIEWIKGDDERLNAKIVSKISLYKGTCLCKEIMAMGQSADDVLINFGPHIFSRLYKATKGKLQR